MYIIDPAHCIETYLKFKKVIVVEKIVIVIYRVVTYQCKKLFIYIFYQVMCDMNNMFVIKSTLYQKNAYERNLIISDMWQCK